MAKTIQHTLIQHRNTVIVPKNVGNGDVPVAHIVAFAKNLEKLGYRLSKNLFVNIQNFGTQKFDTWAEHIITDVKNLKGASFKYEPMYPGFPRQVADASAIELYLNAIAHYYGDVRIIPDYVTEERPKLVVDDNKYVELGMVNESEAESVLNELFINLVSSKVALSRSVKDDVKLIASTLAVVPVVTKIEVKENLALYMGIVRENVDVLRSTLNGLNNPTDVLRIAAVFGNTDASLADSVNFGKLSRPERKVFVAALNNFDEEQLVSAFKRHITLWKKFMKHVHVSEYKTQFPLVNSVVDSLRNGKLVDVYNSVVEQALLEKNFDNTIVTLSQRPSLLVRRLYELLTVFPTQVDGIVDAVNTHAYKASSQVLVQAYGRFTSDEDAVRIVFGRSSKRGQIVLPANTQVPKETITQIAEALRSSIAKNFANRGSLGKVYIPETQASHAVPFGLRSASDSFKLIGRGTRLPFDTKSTLRFFTHWKDTVDTRVDVDLSAIILDKNFSLIEHISYQNLKSLGSVHSGDITSAPKGAAEFIDIKPSKVVKSLPNARYIVMSSYVYYGPVFNEIPEALAGFMVRDGNTQKGKIFDARTVDNVFKITSPTRYSLSFVFDIVKGEAYWLDLSIPANKSVLNVLTTTGETQNFLAAVMGRNFVSVETLFQLHAESRATEIVDNAEDADTVLDYDMFTFDEILSNWI